MKDQPFIIGSIGSDQPIVIGSQGSDQPNVTGSLGSQRRINQLVPQSPVNQSYCTVIGSVETDQPIIISSVDYNQPIVNGSGESDQPIVNGSVESDQPIVIGFVGFQYAVHKLIRFESTMQNSADQCCFNCHQSADQWTIMPQF